MKMIRLLSFATMIAWMSMGSTAGATDYTWGVLGGGNQDWNTAANWSPAGVPSVLDDSANLNVDLSAPLTVDMGSNSLTVSQIKLGSTTNAVSTTITGSGQLILDSSGTPRIDSYGLPGTVDTISVPITLTKGLTINNQSNPHGTVELSGNISGAGGLVIGVTSGSNSVFPLSTTILSGNNTFSGRIVNNRGNVVLGSDTALGTGDMKPGNPSNQFGFNLYSTDDARKISIPLQLAQWQTIKGEHSLEWAGVVGQTNSRGFVNLLPDGKALTLSGKVFAVSGSDLERILTFDGSGKTVITGGMHDYVANFSTGEAGTGIGSLQKRGTGTMVLSGGNSTYTGDTIVFGGNLHFETSADYGATASMISRGGAVGVDSGSTSDTTFLGLFDAEDHGGLMLAASEASVNLDFQGSLSSLANMSVAAPETGLTYTGTITPANNTYRLGGGSGTITLPNANQLTGSNGLVATNGGEVALSGTNDYTGVTRVQGKYTTTAQFQAAADSNAGSNQVYQDTTLSVTSLGNGGNISSIGSASAAAENLVVQGGTLKYVGGATSTDRLLTVGTAGATIDASGTGAINFTSTAALAIHEPEGRVGSVFDIGNNTQSLVFDVPNTDDLVIGMPVTEDGFIFPLGITVTAIEGPTSFRVSANSFPGADVPGANFTFGVVDRTLTLSGTNAEHNTLNPAITDSASGGLVHLAKSGSGTWVIAGANTYSGDTTVSAGTLIVNSTTGAGDVTVDADGTIAGNGTIVANLNADGTVAPGDGVGTLSVDGSATLASGSTLAIELAGTSAGSHDLLSVDGALTVSGANLNVALSGGFSPTNGDSFDVLDFGSASGSFASVTLPGSAADWNVTQLLVDGTISFSGTSVSLPGDYNHNGSVDAADYTVWKDNFGSSTSLDADGNGNGTIDAADYTVWKDNFGNSAGTVTFNVVPEPSTVVVAAMMLPMLLRRKRM